MDAVYVKKNLKENWESPLLNNLINSENINFSLTKMPFKPCGVNVLKLLSRVIQSFNYEGIITSYYDSIDVEKRNKNTSSDNGSFVSYVSMVFFPRIFDKNFSTNFCDRFENLSRKTNRVFVSLMNESRAFACIGRLDKSSICDKVKNIIEKDLLRDLQSSRLGSTSGELYPEVTILSDYNITIYNKDYITKLPSIKPQTQDNEWYGVRCVFNPEISSIFIPSVWQDNPNWTIYDILKALSQKAGLASTAWSRSQYIELFNEVGRFT
jgi:AMMECR1 domain-containing protein